MPPAKQGGKGRAAGRGSQRVRSQGMAVVRQATDIILKWTASTLQEGFLERFGLRLPPIRGPFPTELPHLDVRTELLDVVFDLADGRLLHLEFQTRHDEQDSALARFLAYDVALYRRYGRRISTVVIYGASVAAAPARLDGGAFTYEVQTLFLSRESADVALERMRARLARGERLETADQVDLLLAPLMSTERPMEEVVREALDLARALPEEQGRATVGALLALTYTKVDRTLAQRLQEDPGMTSLLEKLIEAERRDERARAKDRAEARAEGLAEGRVEGRVEGRAEGRAEGRVEGQREFARRLIMDRIGSLPPALERRLETGDEAALVRLVEDILAGRQPDES